MIEAKDGGLTGKPVSSHGLNSMIVADVRNWMFMESKMEIPFQQLLAGSSTSSELSRSLYEKA